MAIANSDRLYTFRPDGEPPRDRCTFNAGRTRTGDQALLFDTNDGQVRLRFSAAGDLLDVARQPHGPSEPGEDYAGQSLVRAWMDELGLVPGAIRVKQFVLPDADEPVGIARFPQYMLDLMEDPYLRPDPDERRQTFQRIAAWEAAGSFVLRRGAGSEVFVADDGRSVST